MKIYRSCNPVVGEARKLIYDAYDRGYEQGRKDYSREPGHWTFRLGKYCGEYECSRCLKRSFAPNDYCHICGAPMDREVRK